MLLEGKVGLVTGGSSGIGEACALEMAREGADVCVTCQHDESEAKSLVQAVEAMGRKALAVKCDVAEFEQAKTVVEKTIQSLGRLDILVNNAGMNWDGVSWKMAEEQWDRVIEVNLKGCFNFVRQIAPLFKEQKSGKILNITSINGLRGKFGQTNYAASKAGIVGYTKALAKELGAFGVNVNAIAPGLIETAMIRDSKDREKIIEGAMTELVIRRVGQPEDVANAVIFLVSDKARHITGQILNVDGGQYI